MTTSVETKPVDEAVVSDPPAVGGPRWWAGVAAATVVSMPFAWLLSYGAALMTLLGLFFFALFGLVIGAVAYRFGVSVRPIPITHIRVGTAIIVLTCWSLSFAKEVRDFPTDKANAAIGVVRPLPDGMTADDFKADVASFVKRTLAEEYGIGGLGYAWWVLSSSRMEYPVETMKNPIVLRPVQHRWWWGIRVVLSIVFLWFGVYSQVSPLSGMTDPAGVANPPKKE